MTNWKLSVRSLYDYQPSGVHLIGDDGLRGSHWIESPPGAFAQVAVVAVIALTRSANARMIFFAVMV